ncbi:MAG: RHS repeat-associated core domain-containing protein [Verrucomicrobiota bacterium]
MKTQQKVNWLIVMVIALAGLLPAARAFYAPTQQRWVNRDPINEKGGINLYSSVRNEPVGFVDPLGEELTNIPIIVIPEKPEIPPGRPIPIFQQPGPIFSGHPTSGDANSTQTGTSTTGNAPPVHPANGNPCTTPGAEQAFKRYTGKVEVKECDGIPNITCACFEFLRCKFKSMGLQGNAVYSWQLVKSCPCPKLCHGSKDKEEK